MDFQMTRVISSPVLKSQGSRPITDYEYEIKGTALHLPSISTMGLATLIFRNSISPHGKRIPITNRILQISTVSDMGVMTERTAT